MARARFPLLVLGMLAMAGCGGPQDRKDNGLPNHDPIAAVADAGVVERGPGVWLKITPDDAQIVIDGDEVGTAHDLEADGGFLSLEAGLHQIVVRREGHRTWRAEVTVRENTEPIEIVLEPLPTPGK